jgi:hypothetical protein
LEVPVKVGKRFDPEVAQPIFLKDFDFRDIVPEKLTARELDNLHSANMGSTWLISNHDAHGKQFLRLKDAGLSASIKVSCSRSSATTVCQSTPSKFRIRREGAVLQTR